LKLTPAIQIDLVPTRTPTPEEPEDTSWMEQQVQRSMNRRKIRVKIIQEEDEDDEPDESGSLASSKETVHINSTVNDRNSIVSIECNGTTAKEASKPVSNRIFLIKIPFFSIEIVNQSNVNGHFWMLAGRR
jgi:hypothetical protein